MQQMSSGVGCAPLSCKPPGIQIYMCKNNLSSFCLGTETPRGQRTQVAPFFPECDQDGELIALEENKKENKKKKREKNKTREAVSSFAGYRKLGR